MWSLLEAHWLGVPFWIRALASTGAPALTPDWRMLPNWTSTAASWTVIGRRTLPHRTSAPRAIISWRPRVWPLSTIPFLLRWKRPANTNTTTKSAIPTDWTCGKYYKTPRKFSLNFSFFFLFWYIRRPQSGGVVILLVAKHKPLTSKVTRIMADWSSPNVVETNKIEFNLCPAD